jgi:hypothetical protein
MIADYKLHKKIAEVDLNQEQKKRTNLFVDNRNN